jgi:hypothetical protein
MQEGRSLDNRGENGMEACRRSLHASLVDHLDLVAEEREVDEAREALEPLNLADPVERQVEPREAGLQGVVGG